jgi:hypothetical protein
MLAKTARAYQACETPGKPMIDRRLEMNSIALLLALALAGATSSAWAMDDKKMDMKMDMKSMDTNGDGMISKEEFMKFHEMMFDMMKKNQSGMVDMKDMDAMHHNMQTMHMDKPKGRDAAPKK